MSSKIILWLDNKMKLVCIQKGIKTEQQGIIWYQWYKIFIIIEMITILHFLAKQQLRALQTENGRHPQIEWNWNTCKRIIYHMPINANENKSICQSSWKRWKNFQSNENLGWLIHTSWIKVLSCNMKQYLVSTLKVSSSRGAWICFDQTPV